MLRVAIGGALGGAVRAAGCVAVDGAVGSAVSAAGCLAVDAACDIAAGMLRVPVLLSVAVVLFSVAASHKLRVVRVVVSLVFVGHVAQIDIQLGLCRGGRDLVQVPRSEVLDVVRATRGGDPKDDAGGLRRLELHVGAVDHVLRKVLGDPLRLARVVGRRRCEVIAHIIVRLDEHIGGGRDLDRVLPHVLDLVHRRRLGARASAEVVRHRI